MTKATIAFLLHALVLTGCAGVSVKDLRDEPPMKFGTFDAEYSDIGQCALDKMMSSPKSSWSQTLGNLHYESADRKKSGVMTVTGSYGGSVKVPLVDLVFIGKGNSTLVEVRAGGLDGAPRGAGERLSIDAWSIVQDCSTSN